MEKKIQESAPELKGPVADQNDPLITEAGAVEPDSRIKDAEHDNLALIATLQQENEELKQQNQVLQDKVTVLDIENENLKNDYTTLDGVNNELTQQVEQLSEQRRPEKTAEDNAATSNMVSKDSFEIGGTTYVFTQAAIRYKGNRVTATEVLASPELQQELVNKKIGFIKALD